MQDTGVPAPMTRIPLTIPTIEEDDLQAVRDAVASRYLVQGPRVAAFEEAVAALVGVTHAVAVNNCTAALHLSLLALGIGPGHRVAVTSYSWPATANVIVLCGAEPVFVDIDPRTFNIDPDALDACLRRQAVNAVLPVHAFGGMADMRAVLEVAARYGVPVIEDAACALGADLDGRQAGAWGVMGCFSLHPRKSVTTGEGGLVVTNDAALARTVRILRNHGLDPDSPTPDFVAAGYNLRLTEFQAALGSSQLRKLERITLARRRAAARYDELFAGTAVTTPVASPGARHVYQSYVVLLPADAAAGRAALIDSLKAEGIETTVGTYSMPATSFFRARLGHVIGDFPVTDDVVSRALTLPLFETISEAQQSRVAEAVLRRVSGA